MYFQGASQSSQNQREKSESFSFTTAKPTLTQAGVTVIPTVVPVATTSQTLTRPHSVGVDPILPVKRFRKSVLPSTSVSVPISSQPQVEEEISPSTSSIPQTSSLPEYSYSSMHSVGEDEEEEEEMISIDMKQEPIAVYSLNDDNSLGYHDGDAGSMESEAIEDDTSGKGQFNFG